MICSAQCADPKFVFQERGIGRGMIFFIGGGIRCPFVVILISNFKGYKVTKVKDGRDPPLLISVL